MAAIKNIIFDLGGVIMNIDFKRTELAFAALGFTNFAQHMTQFHITPLFEDFETGRITDSTFVQGIREISGLDIADEVIINAWNALLLDFPLERITLLEKLRDKYKLYLLSNTNALHYKEFQQTLTALTGKPLESYFDNTYFSHTVQLRKPDAAIFQLVVDENNLKPEETLFIDDTASNFTGAEQLGIQVYHLKQPMTLTAVPLWSDEKR